MAVIADQLEVELAAERIERAVDAADETVDLDLARREARNEIGIGPGQVEDIRVIGERIGGEVLLNDRPRLR
jgi:hypothetical protein